MQSPITSEDDAAWRRRLFDRSLEETGAVADALEKCHQVEAYIRTGGGGQLKLPAPGPVQKAHVPSPVTSADKPEPPRQSATTDRASLNAKDRLNQALRGFD